MAWLWLISVGVTDVQFPVWKKDDYDQWTGPWRFEIGRGGVRSVHEGLRALLAQDQITFPSGPLPESLRREESQGLKLDFLEIDGEFTARIKIPPDQPADFKISGREEAIPNAQEAQLPLYCPKVDALLAVACDTFAGEPVTVVVLNTRRANDFSEARSEPIASGPLVASCLAERLDLQWLDGQGGTPETLGANTSTWVDVLIGYEAMEDPAAQQQVVKRLTAIIQAWHTEPDAIRHIAVTTSGGMPPLKPLFERVPATCLGQRHVRLLDQPERGPATSAALNYDDRVTERETLRFHCAEALRQGDYVGAYGLAGRYEASWAQRVRDVLGPFLNLPGNRLALMYHGRPLHRFEIYAVQIEVHLQAGDGSGAVLALNSFLEAATWYLLCANTVIRDAGLTPSPETESINGVWPRNLVTATNIAELLDQDQDTRRNQHKVSKLLLGGLAWLQNNANSGGRYVAAVKNLVELRDVCDSGNPSLRKCRNSIAHGAGKVITPNAIREQIVSAGFNIDQPFGENFLNQKLVSGLLANLETAALKDFIKVQFESLLDFVIRG